MWEISAYDVMPVDDIKPHHAGESCWCNPEYDDDCGLIIHHSMDGREDFENGTRLPS